MNWNAAIIDEFHAKGGRGVGQFGDRLLLLTTKGARSGEERVSPVMFHRDGDRFVIIASKGGAPDNPAWYHNLVAHPEAEIEVGSEAGIETIPIRAHQAEGAERERIYAERVAIAPGFGEYQERTPRRIPVMILERASEQQQVA